MHRAACWTTAAAVVLALTCGRATATTTRIAVTRLPHLSFTGNGLVCGGRFIFIVFVVESVFILAILAFKLQLDLVIQVGLLQHFAQSSGANLVRQRFLFIVFKVVVIRLVMMWRIEFLFINQLFFNDAAAGGKGGDGGHRKRFCRRRSRNRGRLLLLLLAKAK